MIGPDLPTIDEPHHVVAAETTVQLGPIARMWTATGGDVSQLRVDRLPISSTSLWTRSADPHAREVPLQLHFEVKAALGFGHAVIAAHRTAVTRPTRVGDRVGHHQVLRSIGPERMTALGWGRSWDVDHVLTDADGETLQIETFSAVGYRPGSATSGQPRLTTAAVVPAGSDVATGWTGHRIRAAAAACRVWAPVHHDPVAARRAGLPGVIACTQHLVAIAEQARLRCTDAVCGVRVLEVRMGQPMVALREAS